MTWAPPPRAGRRRSPPTRTDWWTRLLSTWSRWSAGPNRARACSARAPGLPDDAYAHDGQLTKRDLRASALSRLAPVPGELLWDLGRGGGIDRHRVGADRSPVPGDRHRPHPRSGRPDHRERGPVGRPGHPGDHRRRHRVAGLATATGRDLRRRRSRPGPDPPLLAPAAGRRPPGRARRHRGDRADPARGLARRSVASWSGSGWRGWSRWVASTAGSRPGRWSSGRVRAQAERY